MAVSSKIKDALNWCLAPANLSLQTRTAERQEEARLLARAARGQFEDRAFPILPQFANCDPAPIFEAIKFYRPETERFSRLPEQEGYSFHNNCFFPPDAQTAYALLRMLKPARIVEVGSGNSTWLFRRAIADGGIETELYSIDPHPRRSIEGTAKLRQEAVENIPPSFFFDTLREGDFLFIDSSHEIKVRNDVHRFGEQYLVQAMLSGSNRYEVIWPGRYLQLTREDFEAKLSSPVPLREATSLWLRVKAPQ